MRLVVAEKPSVGAALASVLGADERRGGYFMGNGWIVSWCVGHLVELADVRVYDERFAKWNLADLPILPTTWQFTAGYRKKQQLDILRNLMHDERVDSVVCATDAGREGELIFRLVYDYCNCKKPIQRLWISSMEESAIRAGFEQLRDGAEYDNLYQAALCRAKADYMVGINATRLFSCLYNVTLNIGRVQTPTLSLVVRREQEIAAFQAQAYYIPQIDTGTFIASGEKQSNQQEAKTIRTACDGQDAIVQSVQQTQKTTAPPRLYDLTTLQREANRIFGFTAQQTLDYTQSLYEKKLCTYPRTDSRFLTSDMAAGIPVLVQAVAEALPFVAGMEVPTSAEQVVNDSKVTDHHAIIPTPGMAKTDLAALPTGERDVLTLITTQLFCAVGEPHRFETVEAVLTCGGHCFTAKGRTILYDGWKIIGKAFRAQRTNQPEDRAVEGDTSTLPVLSERQVFPAVAASVRAGKTMPPRRYTEDSLLAAMESAGAANMPDDAERKGLGTPATRAGIIERLVKTGLIERNKKQLAPTEKGVNLITVVPASIQSPLLTAEWEHRLKQIEHGEIDATAFIAEIATMTQGLVDAHPAPDEAYIALFAKPSMGNCPRCRTAVHERKKGFLCSNRGCKFALWRDDRFFAAKRKTITTQIATALLTEGRVFIPDLYSERTGKTYSTTIVMDDTGKYVNFKLDFQKGRRRE